MKKVINWKLFFILWIASIFANVASIPFILKMGFLENIPLPLPLGVVITLQLIQVSILFAVFIFIGLLLAQRVGFGVPFLAGWLDGKAPSGMKQMLFLSVGLGSLSGLLLFVLDRYIFVLALEPVTSVMSRSPLWTRLLISLYAGIAEELAMRLGLMTLLVWITWKIKATFDNKPTHVGIWIAILIVAIIFSLGHLPATARLQGQITSLIVIRALVLNGIASIVFSWLYWRRGLESAIVSHFSVDIVLHVLLPSII